MKKRIKISDEEWTLVAKQEPMKCPVCAGKVFFYDPKEKKWICALCFVQEHLS